MNFGLHLAQLQQPPAIALATLALMLAAGYGIGALATLPFPVIRRSGLRIPLLTVLGLDLIALCSLLAAPLIVMAPSPVLGAVLGAAALYGTFRLRRDLSGIFRRPMLLLFTAGLGAFTLGSALCLPYAWDEQVYQAALPFRYLAQGSAAVLPDNPYSALASMNHFLLLIPCKLGGILMPRLLVWASYLLIFPWLYLLLERRGKVAAAVLTLAVVLAPVTLVMNRNAYAEGYILLNLLAGLTALRLCRKQPLPMALYLGLFSGMAAAVKLTGGGASLALFFLWLGTLDRDRLRRFGCYAAGAVLGMAPFYLRTFLCTGNPFYPYGSFLFAPGTPAAEVELYHTQLGSHLYGLSGISGILSGWILAAFDQKTFDGVTFGRQFLLMAAAAALAAWLLYRRSPGRFRMLRYPFFAVSALYLFWAFSSQQTRFLYPLLFLAALGAGFLMPQLAVKQRRLCLIAIGAATAFSIFPPGFNHYRQAWKLRTLAAREPVKFLSFAARDPEYFTMLEYIGKHIPADSRLLLLFERRGLYVPREYRIGTPYFQQAHFTPVPADAAGTLAAIRHSGADYLLIGASSQDPDYLEAYNEENAKLAGHLRTLLRDGALTLVEVPGTGAYTLLKVN